MNIEYQQVDETGTGGDQRWDIKTVHNPEATKFQAAAAEGTIEGEFRARFSLMFGLDDLPLSQKDFKDLVENVFDEISRKRMSHVDEVVLSITGVGIKAVVRPEEDT